MSEVPGLRPARKRANLSQEALGDAVGVSGHAIYLFESGRSNPSLDTLHRLAAALGCSYNDLLEAPADVTGGAA